MCGRSRGVATSEQSSLQLTDRRRECVTSLYLVNFLCTFCLHHFESTFTPSTHHTPMSREMALQAYRHLLRSTRIAFQGWFCVLGLGDGTGSSRCIGDFNTLVAARQQARHSFEANRALSYGSDEMSKQISHAEEVAKFLRENVVQGEALDKDAESYSMRILKCKSLHALVSNMQS